MNIRLENNKMLDIALTGVETTLGDLISAITDIAQNTGVSDSESYQLTSETLAKILARHDVECDIESVENFLVDS
jgi:hypothetical protein